jgi:hypothetical protein
MEEMSFDQMEKLSGGFWGGCGAPTYFDDEEIVQGYISSVCVQHCTTTFLGITIGHTDNYYECWGDEVGF